MDSLELFVHISAPGTVRHDKHNLALAQAVADFHGVRILNVMDQEPECQQGPLADEHITTLSAPGGNSSSQKRHASPTEDSTHAHLKDSRKVKRARLESSGFPNPPYRNPWHGRRDQVQTPQTPSHGPRPCTAPESSSLNTIQVPRTVGERPRAYSDPFQSFITRITNSQDVDQVDESSEGRMSSPLGAHQITLGLSQSSLEEKESLDHTTTQPLADTAPSQKLTRQSSHLSSTATATPSQPMEGVGGQRPSSSQLVPDNSPSIITLSSDSPSSQQRFSLSPKGITSKQTRLEQGSHNDCPREAQTRLFPDLDLLSEQAVAPQPLTGSMSSNSHVSKRLQELIEALPLARIFRPIKFTRDIQNLERGYWLMQITIAPDAVVHQARSSPSKEAKIRRYTDRFSATTAQERLSQFWTAKAAGKLRGYDYGDEDAAVGLWTEKEFIEFWNVFSGFIKGGKAGWAVRMVREEMENGHFGNECRQMRVRIFTWGEIIGHIYLAIWICSEKASARISMKWIAGDGTVVVAMSGKRKYPGSLKRFARKGPAGKGGCWGLLED